MLGVFDDTQSFAPLVQVSFRLRMRLLVHMRIAVAYKLYYRELVGWPY